MRTSACWSVLGLALCGSLPPADSCVADPPTLSLARPQDQSRFRVTTFATGLSFPTTMTTLADGSLLVGESVGSMLWTSTTGRLVRLVDANADGVADGPPQELAGGSDLPGMVTSVRRVGDLVVALSSQTCRSRDHAARRGCPVAPAILGRWDFRAVRQSRRPDFSRARCVVIIDSYVAIMRA